MGVGGSEGNRGMFDAGEGGGLVRGEAMGFDLKPSNNITQHSPIHTRHHQSNDPKLFLVIKVITNFTQYFSHNSSDNKYLLKSL